LDFNEARDDGLAVASSGVYAYHNKRCVSCMKLLHGMHRWGSWADVYSWKTVWNTMSNWIL